MCYNTKLKLFHQLNTPSLESSQIEKEKQNSSVRDKENARVEYSFPIF